MRGFHDLGGLAAGVVDRSEHDHEPWEKRVDALMMVLFRKGLFDVSEMRRAIEGLGAAAYERMSYYERWMAAIGALLIEKGVVTVDELGRKMAEVERRRDEAP